MALLNVVKNGFFLLFLRLCAEHLHLLQIALVETLLNAMPVPIVAIVKSETLLNLTEKFLAAVYLLLQIVHSRIK